MRGWFFCVCVLCCARSATLTSEIQTPKKTNQQNNEKKNTSYEGPRSADKFLEFIAKKLEEDAGFARVADLDALAAKFAAAAKEAERAKVLAEAEAAAAKVGADAKANAELYVKFMTKFVKDGKAALAKEAARLERMIGSGSVAAAKVDEMSRKTSVLGAFLEASK